MLSLLDHARPFDRATFDPGHFTASAFVRSPDGSRLLLIHHGKLGIWVQPGGHVDPVDSSLPEAAWREAVEETGAALGALHVSECPIFDLDIHPIPPRKGEPAHEHFDVRFAFVATGVELVASEEVMAARWVALAEVPSLTRDESVLRALRKLPAGP